MSEKGQAWKKRWRRWREQDAQPSTPSVTESAERILAHDGTSTAGDARVCAEFVLAVQERFKERVEDARVVFGQGPDETVRWLSGESRPASGLGEHLAESRAMEQWKEDKASNQDRATKEPS